jgi:hypothetical protein
LAHGLANKEDSPEFSIHLGSTRKSSSIGNAESISSQK